LQSIDLKNNISTIGAIIMIDQFKSMHLFLPMFLQGIAYLYTFANLQKTSIRLV
jgi:hypothetical protein